MTNHETPSDLQGFRRTEAGYFAAFVCSVKNGCTVHGIHVQTGSPDCGERSNSDFAGGVASNGGVPRRVPVSASAALTPILETAERSVSMGQSDQELRTSASNSIHGRWG